MEEETTLRSSIDDGLAPLMVKFWVFALALGALHAWLGRHKMGIDGISYIDLGEAWVRGDWHNAINALWSPLYSWLLGLVLYFIRPSNYYEFSTVQSLNFAIFIATLGCFQYFLSGLLRYHRFISRAYYKSDQMGLPDRLDIVVCYTVFIWSSLYLTTITSVSPDMLVEAFVFLASGIVLRISVADKQHGMYILLGVVLGLGYLTKAPMFPLGIVFLGVAACSPADIRKNMPRALLGLTTFIVISAPFIIAISQSRGFLTFGDSARLNYAWYANDVSPYVHWQGETTGNGSPKHFTKINDSPTIYEFASPIGGTYPLWYDPSYWHEGLSLRFDVKRQLRALLANLKIYLDLFVPSQLALIGGFVILFATRDKRWLCLRDLALHWRLLVPAIAAFGMYSLVHVEARYIAPFLVLLWAAIACAVRLPATEASRALCKSVGLAILITMILGIGVSISHALAPQIKNLFEDAGPSGHAQWQIGDGLNKLGVEPGDKIAIIGSGFTAHWARLAKVRIISEMPIEDAEKYFQVANDSVKFRLLKLLARSGAKVVVTNLEPRIASVIEWVKIGQTNHYAYITPK